MYVKKGMRSDVRHWWKCSREQVCYVGILPWSKWLELLTIGLVQGVEKKVGDLLALVRLALCGEGCNEVAREGPMDGVPLVGRVLLAIAELSVRGATDSDIAMER